MTPSGITASSPAKWLPVTTPVGVWDYWEGDTTFVLQGIFWARSATSSVPQGDEMTEFVLMIDLWWQRRVAKYREQQERDRERAKRKREQMSEEERQEDLAVKREYNREYRQWRRQGGGWRWHPGIGWAEHPGSYPKPLTIKMRKLLRREQYWRAKRTWL